MGVMIDIVFSRWRVLILLLLFIFIRDLLLCYRLVGCRQRVGILLRRWLVRLESLSHVEL